MLTTIVSRGKDAQALIDDDKFCQDWRQLYEECTWSTPYQALDFVSLWFKQYRSTSEPVIVWARNESNLLIGLLVLTYTSGNLLVAGTHHAEYQTWLARTKDNNEFIEQAFAALTSKFRLKTLRLKYLPSKVPIEELLANSRIGKQIKVIRHRRPLMRIDEQSLAASLRKKSNKSRLNRLKRLGDFRFERIQDVERFNEMIEFIIPQYDFRQGAINNSFPFTDDPFKKDLHTEWFRNNIDGLHITVTTLDGKPIAAHIGVVNGDVVHLAILTHTPFLARHSPGKLHILMLGQQLLKDGIKVLDLTPGGDKWKERFANDHDAVYELIVFPSLFRYRVEHLSEVILEIAKKLARRFGITPMVVRRIISNVNKIQINKPLLRLKHALWKNKECRIYRLQTEKLDNFNDADLVKRDELPDLLKFVPTENGQSKQEFISKSLYRLENGEHIYTIVSNNKLLHYGWLIENRKQAYIDEIQQDIHFPPNSAWLYDSHTTPNTKNSQVYDICLSQILVDLRDLPELKYLYTALGTDTQYFQHTIEKFGFQYQYSIFYSRRFGASKKWSNQTDNE